MTMNTPGLVLFSQDQKNERVLPKGMQSERAQQMMFGMFDGLNKVLAADLPELTQTARRVSGIR